jgi:DeoR/GlpR family transcriptional regulator of sugar metabolism
VYYTNMNGLDRHAKIIDVLDREGQVSVATLAEELHISAVTIRRDLEQLAHAGVLRRTRGGAVSMLIRGEGLPFVMRQMEAADVKERMGQAVSEQLRDGEAVALDSGTTGAAVARALKSRRLTVTPFSVQAIAELSGSATANLVLPGGSVRAAEGSIIGPMAEAVMDSLRFDTTVLTCCGASPEDGITAHDLQDAAVKRAMIKASRRVVLVAEGEKFARSAMAVVAQFSAIDVLVTSSSLPEDVKQRLDAEGMQVVVV